MVYDTDYSDSQRHAGDSYRNYPGCGTDCGRVGGLPVHGRKWFLPSKAWDVTGKKVFESGGTGGLLMDEPTSALDPISTLKIGELMTELKKEYTVIVVTHNM